MYHDRGAAGATYTPTSDDLGDTIIVSVTASKRGRAEHRHVRGDRPGRPRATPPAPSDTIAPSISGDGDRRSTLTADPGSWSDPSAAFSYAWRRDASVACVTIAGAAGATYTLTRDDLGETIIVSVTPANAGGQNTATSAATAKVRLPDPSAKGAPLRERRPPTPGGSGAPEAVIGRRAAAAPLVTLVAVLSAVGVLLSHDIRQRERSAAAAHLRATLEAALTEIATRRRRHSSRQTPSPHDRACNGRSHAPSYGRSPA